MFPLITRKALASRMITRLVKDASVSFLEHILLCTNSAAVGQKAVWILKVHFAGVFHLDTRARILKLLFRTLRRWRMS